MPEQIFRHNRNTQSHLHKLRIPPVCNKIENYVKTQSLIDFYFKCNIDSLNTAYKTDKLFISKTGKNYTML